MILIESGLTNSGKGDRNEPKSESPITCQMSEYVVSEMQIIMLQAMLQWHICQHADVFSLLQQEQFKTTKH